MRNIEEAILDHVGLEPKLASDVVESLRDAGWSRVTVDLVDRTVRSFGGFVRSRVHGAGRAIYVATVDFDTITDWHGRKQPVTR